MIVERSGDHCHLTEETFMRIFKHRGTIDRRLVNEKYFVFKEKLLDPCLGRLTILGPFRKYNQIEVAASTLKSRRLIMWDSGESGDARYIQSRWGIKGIDYEGRPHTEEHAMNAVCILSKPHAHIASPSKVYRVGTIILGDVSIKNSPIYFDPTITVDSIHLDNDWYNAVGAKEGTVIVRSEAR
jgi:propanediol utilization protein